MSYQKRSEKPNEDQTYEYFEMNSLKKILRSNLIYSRSDIQKYDRFSRFGFMDPYSNISTVKEFIFFTKPDCHIFNPNTTKLQPALENDLFFVDMAERYPHVLQQLQRSAGTLGNDENGQKSPFMILLSNTVRNTPDFQALTATEMDNVSNVWGSSIPYRKDAWAGDENIDFSLEFEDSKYLDVYLLLLAYEKYERYKTAGVIYPPDTSGASKNKGGHQFNSYMKNREQHDTFGIYRFIVGEDYETILYYAYICGASFYSVPRDAFNDLKSNEPLTFSADFKAFCGFDMNPSIIYNFNNLIYDAYDDITNRHDIPIYGKYSMSKLDMSITDALLDENGTGINGEWANIPLIIKVAADHMTGSKNMGHNYKLKWYR